MACCNDRMLGVELIQVEEFDTWHESPKVYNNYNIQFILPPKLHIEYRPDDKFLECAFVGDLDTLNSLPIKQISDYKDDHGNGLMILATYSNQLRVIEWLYDKRVSVNQRSNTGVTPIAAAVAKNNLSIADWLIQHGASVNECTDEGCTPLFLAAFCGHTDMATKLIKAGALVNWEDNNGNTPLMAACQEGHVSVVEALLMAQASVLQATGGQSALFYAAVLGKTTCLEPVIKTEKKLLSIEDRNGWRLLAVAAFHGNLEFVRKMLQLGADINGTDKYGRTALMAAVEMGHYEIVDYMLGCHASVNLRSKSGVTAFDLALSEKLCDITSTMVSRVRFEGETRGDILIKACRAGDLPVVRHLVDSGVTVNYQNKLGISPLIASCMSGNVSLSDFLIQAQADISQRTVNNLNAYQVAYLMKDYATLELLEPYFASDIGTLCCEIPAIAAYLGNEDVLKNLIQRGEVITGPNSQGISPLMVAAHRGKKQIAKLLLENNADMALQNAGGATALMYAMDANDHDMVDFLIGHGASVNRKYSDNTTLCHLLTRAENVDLLQRLVEYGCNINVQDKEGVTPLMLACQQGSLELVKYFVKLNASLDKQCSSGYDAITYAFLNDRMEISDYLNEVKSNMIPDERRTLGLSFMRSMFRTRESDSDFFKACEAGELPLIQELCSAGQSLHQRYNGDVNALHLVSYHGHEDVCQWMLENGALVNSRTRDGRTALMIASKEGQEDVVEVLIKHKCLLNLRDDSYNSALTFAVHARKISILRLLLRHNALVDVVDGEGTTVLNYACLKGHIDIAMILVENHANVNQRDAYGRTPIMAAARLGHTEVVEFMLQSGAKVDVRSGEDKTAAHYALENNKMETFLCVQKAAVERGVTLLTLDDVKRYVSTNYTKQEIFFDICETGERVSELPDVIDGSFDLNDENIDGNSGLFLAVHGGNHDVMDFLLSKDVDVNVKNRAGTTPLLHAVQTGCMEMVTKLVEKGADIDVKDPFGDDLLTIATGYEIEEMVEFLTEAKRKQAAEEDKANNFLENVVQGQEKAYMKSLEHPGTIPVSKLNTAICYAVLSYEPEMLRQLMSKALHLLDSHTAPLLLCVQGDKPDALDLCLAEVDQKKLDLPQLIQAAIDHHRTGALERLLCTNGLLKRPELKTFILGSLCLAQYEAVLVLLQKYCEQGEGLETPKPVVSSPGFKERDIVRVSVAVDVLRDMQQGHGGWNPKMQEYIGKVGSVHRITDTGDIRVKFEGSPYNWTFHPGALTKVVPYGVGDKVRILGDIERVKAAQRGHGEWTDAMANAVGKTGRVLKVDAEGDLTIKVASMTWRFNPICCVSASEEPQNNTNEGPVVPPESDKFVLVLKENNTEYILL